MTKLARLIAQEEGFGLPGDIPTTHDNPGDLEHAPGETHNDGTPVGEFPTPAKGWTALEDQLQLYAERGLTLEQAIYVYAPPSQNNSARYLAFVVQGLGVPPETPMAQALLIA
jgi:hypothetical protein